MNVIELRKLIGVLHIVMSRGVPLKELNRLLNRGISLGSKFEKFDELLIFLNFKLVHYGHVYGFRKQQDIYDEIELTEKKRRAAFESRNLMFKYLADLQHKSIDDYSLTSKIKEAYEKCKLLFEEFKIYNIFLDWYMLEMQYCHYTFDYQKAENLQKELLHVLFETPALFQKNRISDNYVNLSRTQMYLFKFNEALGSLDYAIKYAPINIEASNFYKDEMAFLNIYLFQYKEAEELISETLKNVEYGSTSTQICLRMYLLSVIKFLVRDYKKSFLILNSTAEIENDRDGWNIGIRLLHIFLTLETEKIDLADRRIESLRKHIERTVKMRSVRKRDVVIFRLLTNLARSGFDFKEVWEDRQKDFNLLRSSDPDYRWVPRSHEMILFDQWFESKVKNIPYVPCFPQPV